MKSDGNVLTKISKCNYFPVDSFLLFLAVVLSIGIVTPGGVVSVCVVTVTCGGVWWTSGNSSIKGHFSSHSELV